MNGTRQARQEAQVVLAIGGLDPSGGAGLLQDAAAIRAAGAYPAAVATALTVQSGARFKEVHRVPPALVQRSIALVLEDLPVGGVKLGALIEAETVEAVAEALGASRCPSAVVVDPVLRSTTGHALLDAAGQRVLMEKLFPLATIVTPNRTELEQLTARPVGDRRSAVEAAHAILESGCQAVLVKGGHFEGEVAADVLVHRGGVFAFEGPRLTVGEVRGTGCALASAIAAYLVQGASPEVAVQRAKDLVAGGISSALALGKGASVLGFA